MADLAGPRRDAAMFARDREALEGLDGEARADAIQLSPSPAVGDQREVGTQPRNAAWAAR